jgi:hypothetical protein
MYRRGFLVVEVMVWVLIGAACTLPRASPAPSPFDYMAFEEAMREAGASVTVVESEGTPLLSREVTVRKVETGGPALEEGARFKRIEVQTYEYPDRASQEADAAQIAPSGSPIGDRMIFWADQPNFWGKGRLIVLYVGRDPAVIRLLNEVMGDPITQHGL